MSLGFFGAELRPEAWFDPDLIVDSWFDDDLIAAAGGAGELSGTVSLAFGAGASTLTGSGALLGTGAIVIGEGSSTLIGAGALAGIAGLLFATSAALTASGALAGAAALLFTPTATAIGAGVLAGSAALTFANTGTLDGAGALAGQSDLVFTATLNTGGAMQGTAAMQFTPAAALAGAAALSGAAGLVFAPVAVLQGAGAVTGAAAMQFSLSGSLDVTGLAGTVTLLFGDGDSTLTGSGSATLRRNPLLPPIYDWAAESTLLQSMLGNSLPMRFYRHGRAPQDIAAGQYDYCTWFAFTGPENTLSEDPGIDRVSIQVDCWVRGGVDAEERIERLAQEVQRILETRGHCTGVPIDERDDKTKKFRIGVTFDIWWPRWS